MNSESRDFRDLAGVILDPAKSAEISEKPKAKKKKQAIQWKRACFTWYNYPDNVVEILETKLGGLGHKYFCGFEICPSTGRPHIQGYAEFTKRLRPIQDLHLGGGKDLHWEKAKGSRKDSLIYNSKEHKVFGNLQYDKPLKLITELYEWQQNILDHIKTEPDDRTINWIYETEGNRGKTALIKLLCAKHNALLVGGKAGDAKYLVTKYEETQGCYPQLVIFSFPRTIEEYVSYTAVEEIKDGVFCSTKYECKMVVMNSPHILCFANFYPDESKLSADRWNIINI